MLFAAAPGRYFSGLVLARVLEVLARCWPQIVLLTALQLGMGPQRCCHTRPAERLLAPGPRLLDLLVL